MPVSEELLTRCAGSPLAAAQVAKPPSRRRLAVASANLKPDELASRLEQDYARLCDQHSVGWEHGRVAALAAYTRAAEAVWI